MLTTKKNLVFLLLGCYTLTYASVSYDKLWGSYTFNGRYKDILYTVEPQIRLVNLGEGYQQFLLNEGIGFGGIQHWQFGLDRPL